MYSSIYIYLCMIIVTYTNLIIPYITSIYFFLASLLKMAQIYSSHSTLNVATTKVVNAVEPLPRRSANYAPSIWSFDDIQSLSSEYTGEAYKERADTLKEAVKMMIHKVRSPLSTLELVDDLHRLGISYHFEDEISNLLEMIHRNYYKTHVEWHKMDLNLKALGFRLLRQCGYLIPQEIFQNFKDETQDLKPHLINDMMGVLNLYEASYHSFEDESILDDARDFTTKYLKENQDKMDESISSLVSHALEVPLHLTVPRIKTKWFIHAYENRVDMNPILIELAKLDFDMVQAVYIEDLKHASRWWRNIGWDKKLTFARDRLVECFLWTIGFNYLPHLSRGRRNVAKIIALVTTIDDVSDVYGTLDELELWDINAVEELPDYMKICFPGLYNTINEITYDTLINTRILILPYIKKADEMERGDIPKLIQCYMNESGATEDEARTYIYKLIMKTWKKLNKERASAKSQVLQHFIDKAMNSVRITLFMYVKGDGHGRPNVTKSHVLSLLFNPIQGI
ncbi:R-linalool synthase QH1, chloroplastic-like [Bidens hawaiensis]|uniref:R-linalool synthase QH1, chloroplastic-like n=1 Tax=Bidens hawaiensis TaxID=980011 RepID=UPI004049B32B